MYILRVITTVYTQKLIVTETTTSPQKSIAKFIVLLGPILPAAVRNKPYVFPKQVRHQQNLQCKI